MEMFITFVVWYLKLSVLSTMALAVMVVHDAHMYPVCHDCGDNRHTRRSSWSRPFGWCRIHGFVE